MGRSYDDEKLGFVKVAPYYYYPGWWEGGPQLSFYVNIKQWESLPKEYPAAIETACAGASTHMVARYDAGNPSALRRRVGAGAILKPFPRDVMLASYKAAFEVYEETAAKNPRFKKVMVFSATRNQRSSSSRNFDQAS